MNETPKRSAGVTLTAVVSILGSSLLILFALLILLGALVMPTQPGMPAHVKTGRAIDGVFCGVLAAWGITTAIGLFRLRGWSRWSVIIFSVLLVLSGAGSTLVMAIVPLPQTPGSPSGLIDIVRIVIVCLYVALALLGAWWLFYFQSAGVRAQFGAGTGGPGGRPLSVWLIGLFLILGGAMCLGGVLLPFPAVVFGLIFRGWAARVFYLAFGAVECWVGAGLLRLRPLSRILALAVFGFGLVNSLVMALLPGSQERVRSMMGALPAGWPGADQPDVLTIVQPAMLLGVLVMLVPIWLLWRRRGAFAKPAGSEQIGGQQPL